VCTDETLGAYYGPHNHREEAVGQDRRARLHRLLDLGHESRGETNGLAAVVFRGIRELALREFMESRAHDSAEPGPQVVEHVLRGACLRRVLIHFRGATSCLVTPDSLVLLGAEILQTLE
jgi:hypothetical protein